MQKTEPLLAFFVFLVFMAQGLAQNEGPTKLEISGAEYQLKNFEQKVKQMAGKPFNLDHSGTEALKRIKDLKTRFPNDPKVNDLVERARLALMASKGQMLDVSTEMVAFRKKGEDLIHRFHDLSLQEWERLKKEAEATGTAILKAFPQVPPEDCDLNHEIGRTILVEDLEYPMNMFTHHGAEFIHVGKPSVGFYYVSLSSRAWRGSYESLRRYRRVIGGEIPQKVKWMVLGKIVGVGLMVPEESEEPTMAPHFGWIVEPEYLYVPDFILTRFDANSEIGGNFFGEERVEEIKGPMYTIKDIPEEVTPQGLVDIYFTAIKERNFKLWWDSIDPARLETAQQVAIANYHWDWHLKRWNETYVHYEVVGEPEIISLQGEAKTEEQENLEDFFLDEEQKEKLKKHSEPTIRQANFKLRLFDEQGKQFKSIQNFYLIQYESKRWFVKEVHLPN